MIIELIEVVFSSILSLISPEKTADKVKDIDTSKSAKSMLIILFTLIYGATMIGIVFSIVHTTEVLYRVFAIILIIFLLYCLFVFYYRIFKYR